MPAVPDSWKGAAAILQLIPEFVAGLADNDAEESDLSDLLSSLGGKTILESRKRRGIEEWLEDRDRKRKAERLKEELQAARVRRAEEMKKSGQES
jgi:hypothetical protein